MVSLEVCIVLESSMVVCIKVQSVVSIFRKFWSSSDFQHADGQFQTYRACSVNCMLSQSVARCHLLITHFYLVRNYSYVRVLDNRLSFPSASSFVSQLTRSIRKICELQHAKAVIDRL
jgi:hypothetical protein